MPSFVDHDRRGVLGCDPRVSRLVRVWFLNCVVVVLVAEIVGDVEGRVVVREVVLAFTAPFRVVVSRDVGTACLVVRAQQSFGAGPVDQGDLAVTGTAHPRVDGGPDGKQ